MQAHAHTHNHVYTHTSRVEVDVATTDVVGGGAVEPPQGLTLQLQDKSEDLAASFAVPQGDRGGEAGRASIFLPWSSFVKQIRWGCSNCQIDPASINGLAVYVLYQPGPFRVTLRRIAAVTSVDEIPGSVPTIPVRKMRDQEVQSLIQTTIARGGTAYDKVFFSACPCAWTCDM